MSVRSWSNWNLEVLVFKEREKTEYPEKNLSEQGREPTTNSTHIWKTCGVDAIIRTQATLVGGECSHQLSPMRHPFSLTVLSGAIYRSFSHDFTAAIFVYKTMNRRPCLCTKKILGELNSFDMLKLSFIPSNLLSCWLRDWKRSIHSSYLANKGEFCSLFPHRANPTNF